MKMGPTLSVALGPVDLDLRIHEIRAARGDAAELAVGKYIRSGLQRRQRRRDQCRTFEGRIEHERNLCPSLQVALIDAIGHRLLELDHRRRFGGRRASARRPLSQ